MKLAGYRFDEFGLRELEMIRDKLLAIHAKSGPVQASEASRTTPASVASYVPPPRYEPRQHKPSYADQGHYPSSRTSHSQVPHPQGQGPTAADWRYDPRQQEARGYNQWQEPQGYNQRPQGQRNAGPAFHGAHYLTEPQAQWQARYRETVTTSKAALRIIHLRRSGSKRTHPREIRKTDPWIVFREFRSRVWVWIQPWLGAAQGWAQSNRRVEPRRATGQEEKVNRNNPKLRKHLKTQRPSEKVILLLLLHGHPYPCIRTRNMQHSLVMLILQSNCRRGRGRCEL